MERSRRCEPERLEKWFTRKPWTTVKCEIQVPASPKALPGKQRTTP